MSCIYKPGDTVRVSSIYKAIHDNTICPEVRFPFLMEGTQFPLCDNCGESVRYEQVELAERARLIRDTTKTHAS